MAAAVMSISRCPHSLQCPAAGFAELLGHGSTMLISELVPEEFRAKGDGGW